MGLKYQIAALTDVAEGVRSLYRAEGNAFVLDAEGVVPKERLDEFRNNNVQLQQQLDKLKDVDPTKYRELIDLDRKVKEKELISKGDVDGVVNMRVETMKTDYEGKLTTLDTELQANRRQLSTLLIDNVIKSAAVANGVIPTALDDLTLRAHASFVVEAGVPVMKKDGQVVYGKDGKTPMTPAEWVVELRKTAPHLFMGHNGSNAGGGNAGVGGKDLSKLTPVQKVALGLSQGLARPQDAGLPT